MPIHHDNMSRPSGSPPRRGFTLIEATISILIVGTMVVMALNTFGSAVRGRKVRATLSQGPVLAAQLMAEILQSFYREPDETAEFGPEPTEGTATRANFDDVDDYHLWSPSSSPQMKDGAVIADLTGWRRSVTVEYVDPADVTDTVSEDMHLKRITVTVTSPAGKEMTLVALRGAASVYDQRPTESTTYVTWVGVDLQIGGDAGGRVLSGASILNQVPTGGS